MQNKINSSRVSVAINRHMNHQLTEDLKLPNQSQYFRFTVSVFNTSTLTDSSSASSQLSSFGSTFFILFSVF